MCLPNLIDVLSDPICRLHQNSLVPDLKVVPFAVYQILISFHFFSIEVLAVSVSSGDSQCIIWSTSILMRTSSVGTSH